MDQVTSGYSEEMPKVTMGRGAVGTMGDSGTAGPSEDSQLCQANRNHVRYRQLGHTISASSAAREQSPSGLA